MPLLFFASSGVFVQGMRLAEFPVALRRERNTPSESARARRDTTACLQVVSKCALAREGAWGHLRKGTPITESMFAVDSHKYH